MITKEQEKEVLELRKQKKKGKYIAENLGLTIYQVYDVYKRYGVTNRNNIIFVMTGRQHQIIISGILGDGRLKKNGKHGYYYSECHSIKEEDYCYWKFYNLGTLTEGHTVYPKNKNNQYSDAVEFCTKTTKTLGKYANMSIEEVIDELDIVSFVLFLLDDGWIKKDSLQFNISGGALSKSQLELLCNKCNTLGLKNVHIIGKKRYDISIPKENNAYIVSIIKRLMPMNMDIIKKKLFFLF